MLSNEEITKIVMMRGLGFSQTEIAKEFNITQGAISYNLKQLKGRAKKEGFESTYIKVMAAGGGMESLKVARLV